MTGYGLCLDADGYIIEAHANEAPLKLLLKIFYSRDPINTRLSGGVMPNR